MALFYCAVLSDFEKWSTLAAETFGFQLYGCCVPKSGHCIIYIDDLNGLTVTDCSKIFKQLRAILAVEAPELSQWQLEVSSPGIERFLFRNEHFVRACGKKARISCTTDWGMRQFIGHISQVTDHELVLLLSDDSQFVCTFSEIRKAQLCVDSEIESKRGGMRG